MVAIDLGSISLSSQTKKLVFIYSKLPCLTFIIKGYWKDKPASLLVASFDFALNGIVSTLSG